MNALFLEVGRDFNPFQQFTVVVTQFLFVVTAAS